MVDIMPKAEVDLLHPKLSISYAISFALIVVLILAMWALGNWLFNKGKAIVPSTTAGDF
jgi:hypothetical protein